MKYRCFKCNRSFPFKRCLVNHLRGNGCKMDYCKTQNVKCPDCNGVFHLYEQLKEHIFSVHNVEISIVEYTFPSSCEFLTWLGKVEKKEICQYRIVSHSVLADKNATQYYLACYRSGFLVSTSSGVKRIKIQGNNIVFGTCPSSMVVTEYIDGAIHVTFYPIHFGHDLYNKTFNETTMKNEVVSNNMDKQKYVKRSHSMSKEIDMSCIIQVNINSWKVQSCTESSLKYYVTKFLESCQLNDDVCLTKCSECNNACTHMYRCECPNYLRYTNLCKHIHAVIRFSNLQEPGGNINMQKFVKRSHSLSRKINLSSIIQVNVNCWEVQSCADQTINYKISKLLDSCQTDNEMCITKCSECYNACTHMYQCECPNYEVHKNLCKHIHAVIRFSGLQETVKKLTDYDSNLIYLDQLSETEENTSPDVELEKIHELALVKTNAVAGCLMSRKYSAGPLNLLINRLDEFLQENLVDQVKKGTNCENHLIKHNQLNRIDEQNPEEQNIPISEKEIGRNENDIDLNTSKLTEKEYSESCIKMTEVISTSFDHSYL